MQRYEFLYRYGASAHEVTRAMLVSKNNKTLVMLMSQTNPVGPPVGIELFSYVTLSFVSKNLHGCWFQSENALS